MRAYGSLLVAGIVFSTPATAQFIRSPAPVPSAPVLTTAPTSRGMGANVDLVLTDIHQGAAAGQLSHKQAKELRIEAGEISALQSRYAADGLSDSEAAELRTRTEVLHAITNAKRSGLIK
jgi:hypothetical protein